MTSKWDIQGRSIDLSGKKRLVVVDFDNTCILACYEKKTDGSIPDSFAEWESMAQECIRCNYVGLDICQWWMVLSVPFSGLMVGFMIPGY